MMRTNYNRGRNIKIYLDTDVLDYYFRYHHFCCHHEIKQNILRAPVIITSIKCTKTILAILDNYHEDIKKCIQISEMREFASVFINKQKV